MARLTLSQFKGLNTALARPTIQDSEFSYMNNWDLTDNGYARKRRGVGQLITDASWGTTRLLGRFNPGSLDWLIFHTTNPSGTAPYNFGTLRRVGPSGTGHATLASMPWSPEWGAQNGDSFYMVGPGQLVTVTSAGGIIYHTGGTTATAAEVRGTFCTFFKDRMWIVDTSSQQDTLKYSVPLLASTATPKFTQTADWSTTQALDVGAGDGDWITSVIPYNDSLIIFKTKSTWILFVEDDEADWVLRNVSPTIGCISRSACVVHDNMLYFEAHDGVYRTDGTTFTEISQPIRDQFYNRTIYRNETTREDFMVVSDDKLYLFSYDINGVANRGIWVYHLNVKGWTTYTFTNVTPWGVFSYPDLTPDNIRMGGAGFNSGVLTSFGSPSRWLDRGTVSPTATMRSKYFDFGEPAAFKRMRNAGISYNSKSPDVITYRWQYEGLQGATPYVNLPASASTDSTGSTYTPIKPVGWHKSVALELTTTAQNGDAAVYSITMEQLEKPMIGKKTNSG